MKIQNKKTQSRKKVTLLVIGILLVIAAGVTGYAYTQELGPFDPKRPVTERTNPQEDAPVTPSRSKDAQPQDTPNETSNTPTDSASPGYVSTPLASQPDTSEPYPIENEHYRIAENKPSDFTVTLYPIANNPDYINYDAQLKAYKDEVLDYLTSRYGSTNNLTIKWIPDEATNL